MKLEKVKEVETDVPTQERERKLVIKGCITYSFGKNGCGLSDEFIEIGQLINKISKDNYVYIKNASIDTCDDVYDLIFDITPHEDNEWMVKQFMESNVE